MPTAVGIGSRIISGALWQGGGQVVTLALALLTAPIVIRRMGPDSYGTLSLINTILAYLAITDLGMGLASTRYGALAFARGDAEEESGVIWSSLFLLTIPVTLTVVVIIAFSAPICRHLLSLSPGLQDQGVIALRLAAFASAARVLSGVFNTPQQVRLRQNLLVFVNLGCSVFQILAVPAVLLLGGGLVSAVVVITTAAVVAAALQAAIACRFLPALMTPRLLPRLFGPLALYGGPEALSSMVLMLLLHAEKLLIPVFASTRSLAYYSVAFSLASILTVVPHAINLAALPAFSRVLADADNDRVESLYGGLLRINLFWIVPALLLAVTGGRPFISLWAGAAYAEKGILPFYILLVGVFSETTTSIAHVLLQALGRTDLVLRITLIQAVPYLVGVVLATYYMGPVGAALAWSLRGSANAVLRVWMVRQVTGLSPNMLPRGSGAYARAVAVLIIPPVIASPVGGPAYAVVTLAAVVAHLAVVWTQVLTAEEKSMARGFFHRLQTVGGGV